MNQQGRSSGASALVAQRSTTHGGGDGDGDGADAHGELNAAAAVAVDVGSEAAAADAAAVGGGRHFESGLAHVSSSSMNIHCWTDNAAACASKRIAMTDALQHNTTLALTQVTKTHSSGLAGNGSFQKKSSSNALWASTRFSGS